MAARFFPKIDVREPVTLLVVGLSCFLLVMPSAASAQDGESSPPACASEEHRQFDFWVGEWKLTWRGPDGEERTGTDLVDARYDDCVIYESFEEERAGGLVGMSVSSYSAASGRWRQTWVDNAGNYLDFTGEYEGDKMALSRQGTRGGDPVIWRMVWYNITPDDLDWVYQLSSDGGATWEVVWPIHYERKR